MRTTSPGGLDQVGAVLVLCREAGHRMDGWVRNGARGTAELHVSPPSASAAELGSPSLD
jgi:hypothetical protein